MELSTINSSLIGRKVSCSYGGFNRTGTIIALVDDEYTAGVRIALDEPVFFATGYGVQHTEWFENEFNSTARKFDGKGNLEYTKLIN